MASDDSRLQELLNMQNTANMSISPAPDQPSGQFSGDDIEFEAFMFDKGTGPLTPPASMNAAAVATPDTQVSPTVPVAPMSVAPAPYVPSGVPAATASPAFEITGQEVPVPSYLRTSESQPPAQPQMQAQAHDDEPQPYQPPTMPRGTGPLGGLHTSSNLSARLAQLQSQTPQQEAPPAQGTPTTPTIPTIRGTGPLSRRGTGPLGGATAGVAGAGGDTSSAPQPPSPQQGPINPAYFRSQTGPLREPSAETATPSAIQRISSTGPLNSSFLRPAVENSPTVMHSPNSQPWQASPTTWSDSALAAIEDFSAVLLSMHATRPSSVSLHTNTGTTTYDFPPITNTERERDWKGQAFENTYTAPSVPTLEEPPAFEEPTTQVSSPGWGDMTGAPPASDYAHSYDQVATPDYSGPEMDNVVPMEEPAHAAPEQTPTADAEMQMQTQQPEQVAYPEQAQQPVQAEAPVYNSINPNDLQFEGFMFNEGESAVSPVGPPLPGMEEFMPAVVSMEAAFEEPALFAPAAEAYEQPAYAPQPEPEVQQQSMEAEPAPFSPAMQMETEPAPQMPQPAPNTQEMAQEAPPVSQDAQTAQTAQAAPAPQTGAGEQGPLPFWLQDTSDLEVIARQGYVNISAGAESPPLAMQSAAPLEAPVFEALVVETLIVEVPASMPEPPQMQETALEAETTLPPDIEGVEAFNAQPFDMQALEPTFQPYSAGEPEMAELQSQNLYEDLPPIEPFDFSALALAPQEEELGFNTEELTGMMPSRHDPMRATADLDVLADIFDGTPVSGPLDTKPAFLRTSPLAGLPVAASETEQGMEEPELTDTPQGAQPTWVSQVNTTSPIASFLMPADDEDLEGQTPAAQTGGKNEAPAAGGWTSMVTSALSLEAADEYESLETGMLATGFASNTEALSDLGVDIEPFDYTQLNLEQEQEVATGMLNPVRGRRQGSTGDLVMPGAQSPAMEAASPWTERTPEVDEPEDEDEESWKGTERDTSLFMSTSPRTNESSKTTPSAQSTRWLTDDGVPDSAPAAEAPVQPQAPEEAPDKDTDPDSSVFKARVAWADATEPGLPNLPTDTNLATSQMAQDVEQAPAEETPDVAARTLFGAAPDTELREGPQQTQAQATTQQEAPAPAVTNQTALEPTVPDEPVYNYQPMQGYGDAAEPRIEMPKIGAVRDIYTSGPLPELEGFESLRILVDNNPDDIGAHMALAAAYTQLGDPDTALRVYRRVLKKRTISASIIRLITEELNDFEAELQGNAKYHQVRGDLYTRQGRHQEAVREYNKIV